METLARYFTQFAKGSDPNGEVLRALNSMLDDVHPVDGRPTHAAPFFLESEIVYAAARGLKPISLEGHHDATAAALGWLAPRLDRTIADQWAKAGIKPR